ncbi:unnamed protein product, partial [Urochloa humidicola]
MLQFMGHAPPAAAGDGGVAPLVSPARSGPERAARVPRPPLVRRRAIRGARAPAPRDSTGMPLPPAPLVAPRTPRRTGMANRGVNRVPSAFGKPI